MNLLTVENLTKSYTERLLFKSISFGIDEADRIGLIGINGTGKSTLLKIIAGIEESDDGNIIRNSKLRIAYLPQKPEFDLSLSILANVCKNQKAEQEYRNIEGEAIAMLQKLGITSYNDTPEFLSGGQKKRVSLVRALLIDTNLLILDEPTNHLDSDMIEWLEEALKRYRGAILMVTHDRYFLDEVTTRIFELDKGNLYSYSANYSRFVEMKAEREAMASATERKSKSLYKSELAWMLRGARARSTKQKAHIQRFESLKNRDKIEEDGAVEISSGYSRLGRKTVELDTVTFAYEGQPLIKEFSYIFLHGERIGIIGQNGCGKSTLLKLITKELEPQSGTVEHGTTIKIGYFAQENETVDGSKKVIEYIRDTAENIKTKDGILTASQMCENFLFDGTMQYTLISKLSGGEKRRLFLLKLLMEAPNLLILDEPTNDLDIQTLTILEDYLLGFEGIVIAVSHDRYFLDKVAGRIFAFQGNGSIKQYEGNYTDYINTISDEEFYELAGTSDGRSLASVNNKNTTGSSQSMKAGDSKEQITTKNNWKQPNTKIKFTYAEQKEYDTIDDVIAELDDRIAAADTAILESASSYSKLEQLMHEKAILEAELEKKMDRWVYLNDLAEQIAGQ